MWHQYQSRLYKKSGLFKKIIVSTDCKHIKKLSESYGAEVPFIRPKKYSSDKATDTDVIDHFVEYCNTALWFKIYEDWALTFKVKSVSAASESK